MATFDITRENGRAHIAVQGDLTASSVPGLRERLKALLSDGAGEVEFDFTAVEVVDSSGIGLLVATHNTLDKAGGKIAVTGASEDVLGLFRAMRLDRHFTVGGR